MAPSRRWLKSILAAQLIIILQVSMTIYKSFGDKPTFYFYKSPSLILFNKVHWLYFFFNEFIKVITVLISNSIKTGAADNLFFESFVKIKTFLTSNENVDNLNFRKREKKLLKKNLSKEASGTGDKKGFSSVLINNCHMKVDFFILKRYKIQENKFI